MEKGQSGLTQTCWVFLAEFVRPQKSLVDLTWQTLGLFWCKPEFLLINLQQWFSTGLALGPTIIPIIIYVKIFNFSNVFNEKMVQFEPEIVQNITVCQHKKKEKV